MAVKSGHPFFASNVVRNLFQKIKQLFRDNLENTLCFLGVAYPLNKILKTCLKMQAFLRLFYKILLGSEQLENTEHNRGETVILWRAYYGT